MRRRLGLMLVLAGLTLVFVWDSVHGQGFQPRPGMGMPGTPRPPFGGGNIGGRGGVGGSRDVYTCSKCSREVGKYDPTCPYCGVRFTNGGIPVNNPAGRNPGMAPGMMPGTGPGMIPPNTPAPPQNLPPSGPAQNPLFQEAAEPPVSSPTSTTTVPSGGPPVSTASGMRWVIPVLIGIVVLAILGAGGIWMLIANSNSNKRPARRSRSRRRRDEDDYE